jgi:hypothetical protein
MYGESRDTSFRSKYCSPLFASIIAAAPAPPFFGVDGKGNPDRMTQ